MTLHLLTGIVFLVLRLIAAVIVVVTVRIRVSQWVLTGALLVLLLSGVGLRLYFLLGLYHSIQMSLGMPAAGLVLVGFNLIEILGYLLLLVGFFFLKPQPEG